MDGNYQGTIAIRLAAADTIVFLDLPRAVCLWRVLGRWLRHRGTARPDLAPGCPETLDWAFLGWIWKYPHDNRPAIMRLLNGHAQSKAVVILRTPSGVRRFLREMALMSQPAGPGGDLPAAEVTNIAEDREVTRS